MQKPISLWDRQRERCSLKKASKWVCTLNSYWTELIIKDADGAVQMIRTAPDVSWSKLSLNHFRHTNGFPLLITYMLFSHRYNNPGARRHDRLWKQGSWKFLRRCTKELHTSPLYFPLSFCANLYTDTSANAYKLTEKFVNYSSKQYCQKRIYVHWQYY